MTSVVLRIMVNSQYSLYLTLSSHWLLITLSSLLLWHYIVVSQHARLSLVCFVDSLLLPECHVVHLLFFPSLYIHCLDALIHLHGLKCHLPSRDFHVCVYSSISLLYLTFPLEGLIETSSLIRPKLTFSSSSPKPMSLYHPFTWWQLHCSSARAETPNCPQCSFVLMPHPDVQEGLLALLPTSTLPSYCWEQCHWSRGLLSRPSHP